MKQRGVALITAMLVVALAATAAVAIAVRQHLDIRRAANVLEHDQSLLYVMGIEGWAGQVLVRDAKDGQRDHLKEDWATKLPPIPVEGGQLAGELEDLHGRFNINSLVKANGEIEPVALERLRQLLGSLNIDPELAERIADWLDKDDATRSGGAEDVDYLALEVPYRTGNGVMGSVSEIRLIQGVTPEMAAVLEPYLSALPRDAALDVNTLSPKKPELLMALGNNMTKPEAEQILAARPEEGWNDVTAFIQSHPALNTAKPQGLTVSSRFFMLTSHVQIGGSTFTTYSLLDRNAAGARVVARAQGTL